MSKGFQLIHDRATRWTVLDKSRKVGKQSRLHTGYDTLLCEKLYESHKKFFPEYLVVLLAMASKKYSVASWKLK